MAQLSGEEFLVRVELLSTIFRAKFRDELKKTDLYKQVPPEVWKQKWLPNCIPVGSGKHAFEYLSPYIFRVAITNNRILKLENGEVTFQYKVNDDDKPDGEKSPTYKTCTLPAEKFISRFNQHILPDGFMKVRYYGLLSSRKRDLLNKAKTLLGVRITNKDQNKKRKSAEKPKAICCPKCGGKMILIRELRAEKKPYFGKTVRKHTTSIRAP